MHINFDLLIGDKPIAVHIPTEEDGELFLNEMKIAYPSKVENWEYAHFSDIYHKKRGGVCYCPYFNDHNALMTYGHREHFTYVRKYEVVEFSDLFEEETELLEVDSSLDFLFGL